MALEFKLSLLRRLLPASLDLTDRAALRAWMTRLVTGEFATMGQVVPRLQMVCATHLEEAPLVDLPPGHGWGAAVWRQLAARQDVLASFRLGTLNLPYDGALRRCACILELVDAREERWWFAFWELPVALDRGAEFSWLAKEGDGFGALPPQLQGWLETAGRRLGIDARPLPVEPGARLLVHFGELGIEPPRSLTALARLSDRLVRDAHLLEQVKERPPLVLILRDRTLERWQLTGGMPCNLDDLVRNLCRLGDVPDAVVVLDRTQYDGAAAVRVSVERGGERLTRTLVLGGTPVWRDPVRAELGEHAWIGRAPQTDLGLEPEGYPGLAAPDVDN